MADSRHPNWQNHCRNSLPAHYKQSPAYTFRAPRRHGHCRSSLTKLSPSGYLSAAWAAMIPTKKTEPVLSRRRAPQGLVGVVRGGWRAPSLQLGAQSFMRGVVGLSGCGMKPRTPISCGSASAFDSRGYSSVGHRRMSRHRLRCCPQQGDRWRRQNSSRECASGNHRP